MSRLVVRETRWVNESAQTIIESALRPTWPLPLWVTILLSVSAVAFAVWFYLHERGSSKKAVRLTLAVLRASVLLLLLWMAFGWSLLQYRTSKPELAVVVDRSDSMLTVDVGRGEKAESRLDAALKQLSVQSRRIKAKLTKDYVTRWFWMASGVEAFEADWPELEQASRTIGIPTAESGLGDALGRIVGRQSGGGTAAIVVVSDGINTSGQSLLDAAQQARAAAIPMYVVGLGQRTGAPDLRVADVLLENKMYLGDIGIIDASIVASDATGAQTYVTLTDVETGQELGRQQVMLDAAQGQASARLRYVPRRLGRQTLSIEVEPIDGEMDIGNNQTQVTVDVEDRTIRVLLVFGQPSYEYRFLKHWLERSKQRQGTSPETAFEVDCVLLDGASVDMIPATQAELSKYDAFVFGDFDPQLISRSAMAGIRESVIDHGAGCLFIFGNGEPTSQVADSPLGGLMPVRLKRSSPTQRRDTAYRWQVTTLGETAAPMQLGDSQEASLSLWNSMPRLLSLAQVAELLPASQVLAVADSGLAELPKPLVVAGFAGGGRVAVQLTDESYLLTSTGGTDAAYQRYWGQMLRWLTRGRLVDSSVADLRIQPERSRSGEPVRFSLYTGQGLGDVNEIQLELASSNGSASSVRLSRLPESPRILQTTVEGLLPGEYTASWENIDGQQPVEKKFVVSSPPSERANLKSDYEALRELAEVSRGQFYQSGEVANLFDDLPRGRRARLGGLPPKPVWNSPWIALLMIGLLTAEWILRRKARML